MSVDGKNIILFALGSLGLALSSVMLFRKLSKIQTEIVELQVLSMEAYNDIILDKVSYHGGKAGDV